MPITFPFSKELLALYERTLAKYQFDDAVTGVDIGYKTSEPGSTYIRVLYRNKIEFVAQASGIETKGFIPGPQFNDGKLNVKEPARIMRHNELVAGISVGYYDAGTLGLICRDNYTNAPCLLTCYHVLWNGPGDPVTQPAPGIDGGNTNRDTIARLSRFILNRQGDAALAILTGARPFKLNQYGTADIIQGIRPVKLGETLHKSGRTTAVTSGSVDGIGRYFVNYNGMGRVGIDGFRIAAKVAPGQNRVLCGPGDSGAVWYSKEGCMAVGLHFAGEAFNEDDETFALACHLPNVFEALNISILKFHY